MKKEITLLLGEYLKKDSFKDNESYEETHKKLLYSIDYLLRKGEPFMYEYEPIRDKFYTSEINKMDKYHFFGDIHGFEIIRVNGNILIGDRVEKEVSDEYVKKHSPEVGGHYILPGFGEETYNFPTRVLAEYKRYDRWEDKGEDYPWIKNEEGNWVRRDLTELK